MKSLSYRYNYIIVILSLSLLLFTTYSQAQNNDTLLSTIISDIEGYSLFDRNDYPLGVHKESLAKKNAEFAS